MNTDSLDSLPLWGFLIAAVSLLWFALECGYRIGRWRLARAVDEKEQPVGAMVGSILGLLALVLGFTFNLAASRFEARREAVLEEANAIGTAYLRSRLLPEPQQSNVGKLMREYVDVRVRGVQEGTVDKAVKESEALHELLWAQANAATEKPPSLILVSIFIQSLNEVIDVHSKRVFLGLHSRIPLVIWVGVSALALLGMAAVGYQAGLSATRRSPAMLGLVLAFAMVLLLIADLDRGQEGTLRVSQQAMMDLQRSMQSAQRTLETATDEHPHEHNHEHSPVSSAVSN